MSRCFLPDPWGHAGLAIQRFDMVWEVVQAGGCFEGRLCVDASGACPTDPLLTRVGWGAVQVGGSFGNQILGAVRGTLNHPLQEVGMGDILVVAELLRFCPPYHDRHWLLEPC